jgi:hypothetical protein
MSPTEHAKFVFSEAKSKSTDELLVEYAAGGTYGPGHPAVEMLIHQRLLDKIAMVTHDLNLVSEKTYQEIALLNSSSDRLEKLTKTLKNLTWALIFLTVIAAAVPVGIEVWKGLHQP